VLHVTNGSSVALAETGIGGEILFWDDVLHEGPVPQLPLDELSDLRAHFIAEAYGHPEEDVCRAFEQRDATLRSFGSHDELVLWFEHDLFDQLQLLQVLDWLASTPNGSTRISLIQAESYLGRMSPSELSELFPQRAEVTDEQLRLATAAWKAFTAADPTLLIGIHRTDTSALPHLHAALRRLFEQYPWVGDGLSRTERQILQVVSAGASTMGAAFRADQRLEDPQFMSDAAYARQLRGLGACRNPLLHVDEHGTLMKITLRLTAAGRNVLEGKADHVALNGIDRWIGGVHLSAGSLWRWNGSELVRSW
jgi:hypothetical protein